MSTIYQLSSIGIEGDSSMKKSYRTDSFRQAVLSGPDLLTATERVSNKRDSMLSQKDIWSSGTLSTLEFNVPSADADNANIYQIILSSSLTPSPMLIHAV